MPSTKLLPPYSERLALAQADECPAIAISQAVSVLQSCQTAYTVEVDVKAASAGFVDLPTGDLHLAPTSAAIDHGLAVSECSAEPEPNGCRANAGAYGGTAEATTTTGGSHCAVCPAP